MKLKMLKILLLISKKMVIKNNLKYRFLQEKNSESKDENENS
mgnify:CR=1 FL=1